MSRVCLGRLERRARRMQRSKCEGFLEGSLVKKEKMKLLERLHLTFALRFLTLEEGRILAGVLKK